MKYSNVKIISDGTSEGTSIYVENKPMSCVQHVTWEVDAKTSLATATITVIDVDLTLKANEHEIDINQIKLPHEIDKKILDDMTEEITSKLNSEASAP